MLVYNDNNNIPYGAAGYKSVRKNRRRSSIRAKAPKRGSSKRQRKSSKVTRKNRKLKRRRSTHPKLKKLSVKSKKFLKTLGFKVKSKY